MRRIIFILILPLLVGCATVNVEKQEMPDGTKKCTAHYTSIFKDVGKMKLSACDADGNVTSSQSDNALLEAIIGALKKTP